MSNPATDFSSTRLSTYGGIPYKLQEGYPQIVHSDDGTEATERYVVRASDIESFVAEAMPPPYVLNGYVILPDRRRMPGTVFVTRQISIAPFGRTRPCDFFGQDAGAADGTYDDLASVTIEYDTKLESGVNRDRNDPTTFLDHSVQVGGEFYKLKTEKLRYAEDGDLPAGEQPDGYLADTGREVLDQDLPSAHLTLATIAHTFRWSYVLSPDWSGIFAALGTCNDAVLSLFKNAPIETVLFEGVSGSQKHVWNGASAAVQPWSLDFKFSQRVRTDQDGDDVTWNHVFSNQARKWVKPFYLSDPTDASTKKYLYETSALLDMFKSSQ